MKNLRLFSFLIISVSLLSFSNTFAQRYTRWNLPQGAIARLGKGKINEIKYSPDGNTIAVASSIGVWLYNAHTGAELALMRDIHVTSTVSPSVRMDKRLPAGVATTRFDCGIQRHENARLLSRDTHAE